MNLPRLRVLRFINVSTRQHFLHRNTSTLTSGDDTSSQWRSILFAQQTDRTEIRATEADFFNYTAKRWLYNEEFELSQRRVQFSIPGLFDIAIRAAGNGASKCIHAVKYREGQYNKTFRLTLDNDSQVVVKIPNPNAGPSHFTTASEVATMDYVRNELQIPVPKVLAWDASTTNIAGAEYIIMEPARGQLLSDIWYQLDKDAKFSIITQVVGYQATLAAKPMPAIGALYHADEVVLDEAPPPWTSEELPNRFTVGPMITQKAPEEQKSSITTRRGPWRNLTEYALDLGHNELSWLASGVEPRMNYFRQEEEQPGDIHKLVEQYLTVAPLITQSSEDMSSFTSVYSLSHSDLNLSNIFFDPLTKKVTDVVDWQGSRILPLLLQAKLPRMVQHTEPLELGLFMPEKPVLKDDTDSKEAAAANKLYQSALCQKYYETRLAKSVPDLYLALWHKNTHQLPLIEPLEAVLGSWTNRTIFRLRGTLINIVKHWHDLFPTDTPCPITFDEQVVSKHNEELENLDSVQSVMEGFQQEGILPADGIVDPIDYHDFQEINAYQKKNFLALAQDEEERELMEQVWPWQDWPERTRTGTKRTDEQCQS